MTWITTIPYEEATGRLKSLYDQIKGPDNNIDNIMLAHSLRPHTMEGHLTLYKHVLHNSANKMPKFLLEALGTYVSILNKCAYCVEHHYQGLRRLIDDDARCAAIRAALEADDPERAFDGAELATMGYARTLTLDAGNMSLSALENMRSAGISDGEILEINQVVAYFAYANRTVLGLGIDTEGDVLGLSPSNSDDASDWSHG